MYLIGLRWVGPAVGQTEFYSYQLLSGEFRHIHTFPGGWDYQCGSLAASVDGLIYVSMHLDDHLYVYNSSSDTLDDLGTALPTSSIRVLAAAPSGLIYGIAGLHLFSYNPITSSFSDFGVISAEISGRTALTVADDGRVYGGYERSNQGRLFVYNPATGIILDKGQVLDQVTVNTLVAGPDGRIYGGTNGFCGDAGHFFAYDPTSDSFTDLVGSYGGVYALLRGQDDRIYGGARRDGWELYLFIYDPEPGTLQEIKPIKSVRGHVSELSWASDDRVYGSQTEGSPNLVVYDPAISELISWDTVAFAYTAPAGTAVRVDVLDAQDSALLIGVNSGDSLSSIDPAVHPAVKLRAHLSGGGSDTPLIDSWSVRVVVPWTPYAISGRVADVNNNPIADVALSAGAEHTAVTDENGDYAFSDLPAGTYMLTPTLSGYTFWPLDRTVTLPPDVAGQNFTLLSIPVSMTLSVGITTSLTYTDTQGLPTMLDFAAGAVTETTTLILTPTLTWGGAGSAFAGHAFEIAAFQNDHPVPGFTFDEPVTITIHYSQQDVRVISDESQLALWRWTGGGWEDAANTCDSPSSYDRDLVNRVLSLPVCHLSLFGMFGPTHQTYLPFVPRSY